MDSSIERMGFIVPYLVWTLLVAAMVLPASGLSRAIWRFNTSKDYVRIIPASVAIVIGAVVLGFLSNRLDNVARALPVLQFILINCLLVGVRVGFRWHHGRRLARFKPGMLTPDDPREAVLVLGLNRVAEFYLLSVREFANDRIQVVGMLGRSARHTGRLMQGVSVLGVPEDAEAIIKELAVRGIGVTRIVVTIAFDRLSVSAQEALRDLQHRSGVKVDPLNERMFLDNVPQRPQEAKPAAPASRGILDKDLACDAASIPATFLVDETLSASLASRSYWKVKYLVDFVGAAFLLLLLTPIFIVVSIAVALDIGWPLIFWQQRPGRFGKTFRLLKFRTMNNAFDGNGHRLRDQQRMSPIGRTLRRFRLDELPQLVHILKGDMSFVGPRPLLPVDQSPAYAARLLVRPGLTGWAQVKGGREIGAADKAALDVWYVQNASLGLDLAIVVSTVSMLVGGERIDTDAIGRAWRELVATGICKGAHEPIDASGPGRARLEATPGAGSRSAGHMSIGCRAKFP